MPQIEKIRDLAAEDYRPSEIKARTGVSYPTIRKYLEADDFSPKPPVKERKASVLDPYKQAIDDAALMMRLRCAAGVRPCGACVQIGWRHLALLTHFS